MNTNDDNRRWQTFQGSPNRNKHDGRPRVTLDSRGRVRMNEKAYEIFGSPEAVELHFDPETATIALSRRDPHADNAFQVYTPVDWKKRRYRQINIAPFCNFWDLSPERTMLFTNVRVTSTGKLLLDITTAVPIGKPSVKA
ncbi:MAG: hypothetical protein KBD94_05790 [Pyrinomonadaceae bacterium]|nr:hypothetical protein [Pyrinomonadaceae bacterium]